MPFKRYIVEDMVDADLKVDLPAGPPPDAGDEELALFRKQAKEKTVEALADLMASSGQIRNPTRFRRELLQRENASSSAIGKGIALPHLRSMRPRRLVIAIARSKTGLEFDAPDGEPVQLFFCITAPPYDDNVYLRYYKWVTTELLAEQWLKDALLAASNSHEMVGIIRGLYY
ncbi:MAG: PTS sugar transporter subunit IIA [Planctomycetes bacterium]|nr:PTS sugar transporter subunit IIA [Planctomycetota bacterium]